MRILYIAGTPDAASTVQVEEELTVLRRKLDLAAPSVDVRSYPKIAVDDLESIIDSTDADILHFSAHGQDDGIMLHSPLDGHEMVRGPELAAMLRGLARRPKLVVLNACSSVAMAAQLMPAADFVIGMNATISNIGARRFAASLYAQLGKGRSIASAFETASAVLGIADARAVTATLYPLDRLAEAQRTLIANPLRLMASFPEVEDWLRNGRDRPHRDFDQDQPGIEFGLVGAPDATRQALLFTDDTTVQPKKGESLADARSWFIEAQPAHGEIWFDDDYSYYGDMQWYGVVTTGDSQVLTCKATTAEALQRYYFEEQVAGALPDRIADLIRVTIGNLLDNGGARVGRRNRRVVPATSD